MAWTCPACSKDAIADDVAACPKCGLQKEAWTLHEGRTRVMQVVRGRERFEVRAGIGGAPLEAGAHDAHPGDEATVAWSLPRATALELASRGERPAPTHQLVVRTFAKEGGRSDVRVVVLPARGESVEHAIGGLHALGRETGSDAARVVLVHGRGAAVEFPGLHVVDVTEDDGLAPKVAVSALKKKAKELPVRAVLPRARLSIKDEQRRRDRTVIDKGATVVLRAEVEPEVPGEYHWEATPADEGVARVLFKGNEAHVTGRADDVVKLTCRFREADGQVRHAEHRVEIGALRPVHLRLIDVTGAAFAGAWCRVETAVDRFEGKADERGQVVVRVPPGLTSATLVVGGPAGTTSRFKATLGALPAPRRSDGARARLANLGYAPGEDPAGLARALARFRVHNGLVPLPEGDPDRLLDEATAERLRDAHDTRDGRLARAAGGAP